MAGKDRLAEAVWFASQRLAPTVLAVVVEQQSDLGAVREIVEKFPVYPLNNRVTIFAHVEDVEEPELVGEMHLLCNLCGSDLGAIELSDNREEAYCRKCFAEMEVSIEEMEQRLEEYQYYIQELEERVERLEEQIDEIAEGQEAMAAEYEERIEELTQRLAQYEDN